MGGTSVVDFQQRQLTSCWTVFAWSSWPSSPALNSSAACVVVASTCAATIIITAMYYNHKYSNMHNKYKDDTHLNCKHIICNNKKSLNAVQSTEGNFIQTMKQDSTNIKVLLSNSLNIHV